MAGTTTTTTTTTTKTKECNCATPPDGKHGGKMWRYEAKGEPDRYFCNRCKKEYMGEYPPHLLSGWFTMTEKGLHLAKLLEKVENGTATDQEHIYCMKTGVYDHFHKYAKEWNKEGKLVARYSY